MGGKIVRPLLFPFTSSLGIPSGWQISVITLSDFTFGICSPSPLAVVSYLVYRHRGDINLILQLSARKKISVFIKMSR